MRCDTVRGRTWRLRAFHSTSSCIGANCWEFRSRFTIGTGKRGVNATIPGTYVVIFGYPQT